MEADFGVSSVTKRFSDRPAAAAERKRGFSGQIVLVAVGVDEFKRAFRSFYAVGTVSSHGDLDLRHVCLLGKKITRGREILLQGRKSRFLALLGMTRINIREAE